jgi:hypothetical protein
VVIDEVHRYLLRLSHQTWVVSKGIQSSRSPDHRPH